jgi:hypothetical protein
MRPPLFAVLLLLLSFVPILSHAQEQLVWTMESAPGDLIGEGRSRSFIQSVGTQTDLSLIGNVAGSPSESWEIRIIAPGDIPFIEAVYPVGIDPLSYRAWVSRTIDGNRQTFHVPEGQIEIKKLIIGTDYRLKSLWMNLTLSSRAGDPPLRVEAKYRVDATDTAGNRPPGVHTLLARSVPFGVPVTMQAIAGDDGLPSPESFFTTWMATGGPAQVIFTDPHLLNTEAVFPLPGIYTTGLIANDGAFYRSISAIILAYDAAEHTLIRKGDPYKPFDESANSQGPESVTVRAARTPDGGIRLDAEGFFSADSWLEFTPPGGQPLSVGAYEIAPFAQKVPGQGWLDSDLFRESSGLQRIEVKQVTLDSNGEVTSFWAVVSGTSLNSIPNAIAEFRWRAGTHPTANQPPLVDAGSDLTITRYDEPLLPGRVADNRTPDQPTVSTLWTVVSGPGEVTFADATKVDTRAAFSAPGQYVLRLTAYDGEFEASDTVTVTEVNRETVVTLKFFDDGQNPGQVYRVTSADSDFDASTSLPSMAGIEFQIGEFPVGIYFEPKWGEQFTVGVYRNARAGIATEYAAGAMGSFFPSGSEIDFEIKEIVRSNESSNRLDSFWVTFVNRIGRYILLRGEIRFNVTVPAQEAPNAAPTLDMGAPLVASPGAVLSMQASADDDLLPLGAPVAGHWEQISGPGTVTFERPGFLATTAVFPVEGVYRLKAIASDGELRTTGETTVFVTSAGRSFTGYLYGGPYGRGMISIRVNPGGDFTGFVYLNGRRESFKGRFVNGVWERTRGVYLKLELNPDANYVTGRAGNFNFVAGIAAPNILREFDMESPHAGRYTFIMGGLGEEAPVGYGSGKLNVKPDGSFRLAGSLPDGSPFSQGGPISLDGFLPFAARDISGPVWFDSTLDPALQSIGGQLYWEKHRRPGARLYPGSFLSLVNLVGTRYTPPLKGENSFTLTTEPIYLLGEVFTLEWERTFAIGAELGVNHKSAVPEPKGLKLNVKPESGLFTGVLPDPFTGAPLKFRGAILQGENPFAGGYFPHRRKSGVVQFAPQ